MALACLIAFVGGIIGGILTGQYLRATEAKAEAAARALYETERARILAATAALEGKPAPTPTPAPALPTAHQDTVTVGGHQENHS